MLVMSSIRGVMLPEKNVSCTVVLYAFATPLYTVLQRLQPCMHQKKQATVQLELRLHRACDIPVLYLYNWTVCSALHPCYGDWGQSPCTA
jgi:hypothetical protein